MWLSVSSPQHSQTLFASCFRKCVIKHSVLEAFFCDVIKGTDSYQTKHLPSVVVFLVFLIFQSWGRSNKASFLNREWHYFFFEEAVNRGLNLQFSLFFSCSWGGSAQFFDHRYLMVTLQAGDHTPQSACALWGGKSLVINPLQNILKF